MSEAYYYAGGEKRPVTQLRSAYVTPLKGERVFLPGWRTISLNNKYQLVIPSNVIEERELKTIKLAELAIILRKNHEALQNRQKTKEERSFEEILGKERYPALLGNDKDLLLPTGEIVVKYKPQEDSVVIESKISELGGEIVGPFKSLPGTYIIRLKNGKDILKLANKLMESGLVEFASPNFIEEMPFRSIIPMNELFPEQWHLYNTGQNGAIVGVDVNALDAWQVTTGSPNIVICIIDSGVDSKHEAFSIPEKLILGYDFEDEDFLPDPTTSYHGTACAGVAAAALNTGKIVGIAPSCRIMAIRRASISEHLKMAEALIWAMDNGADIINCSFGRDGSPWVLPDIVRASIDYITENGRDGKGCVIFWAAGNGDESISTDEWASYEKVIAVGAVSDQNTRAYYSDKGPELDICAPSSGGINGITTTVIGGYTDQFGGTSSAAPLAAGVAALQLSMCPSLNWKETEELLCISSIRVDPVNGNYDENGHSDFYGNGRIDAFRAVAFSMLYAAAKELNMDVKMWNIIKFVESYISPIPAGQEILQFIENRKFKALELLKSDVDFRQNVAIALKGLSDAYDTMQRENNLILSDMCWKSILHIAEKLAE